MADSLDSRDGVCSLPGRLLFDLINLKNDIYAESFGRRNHLLIPTRMLTAVAMAKMRNQAAGSIGAVPKTAFIGGR